MGLLDKLGQLLGGRKPHAHDHDHGHDHEHGHDHTPEYNALQTTFKALSADALRQSTASFVDLAKTHLEGLQTKATAELVLREQAVEKLVGPLQESLTKVDEHVRSLEASRQRAYGELSKQVELLAASQDRLRTETSSLVKALRAPATRGRWGEMQLRRALEMAGMLRHCDFVEQPTV